MKKALSLILVAVLMLGLAACGEKPEEGNSAPGVVGKWQNKTTTPDGVVTTQTLEVLENGTANYHVDDANADGTTESYDIEYAWELNGSDLVLHFNTGVTGDANDTASLGVIAYKYIASDDILSRGGIEFKRIG